jgi:hypothetical protein
VVHDELGQPVEGAAVAIGGEVVFTNSTGEFFVRVRSPREYDVAIRLDEFLFPGRWEIVNAPTRCRAQSEASALATKFVLRRAGLRPPATPASAAPAPAPPPAEAPPAQAADTLHRIDRLGGRDAGRPGSAPLQRVATSSVATAA